MLAHPRIGIGQACTSSAKSSGLVWCLRTQESAHAKHALCPHKETMRGDEGGPLANEKAARLYKILRYVKETYLALNPAGHLQGLHQLIHRLPQGGTVWHCG